MVSEKLNSISYKSLVLETFTEAVFENIIEKGEDVGNQQFLLSFQQQIP